MMNNEDRLLLDQYRKTNLVLGDKVKHFKIELESRIRDIDVLSKRVDNLEEKVGYWKTRYEKKVSWRIPLISS